MVSSREARGKQNTPEGAYMQEVAVKLQGPALGHSVSSAQPMNTSHGELGEQLMEQVVRRENMFAALHRVKKNGGPLELMG